MCKSQFEVACTSAFEASKTSKACEHMSKFLELPREEFVVKNSFITIEENSVSSRKRATSCPPSFDRLPHDPETIVMLQNLPNRANKQKIQQHLDSLEVPEEVVLDVPLDKRTGVNRGYAFLTFYTVRDAKQFVSKVQGTQLAGSKSAKRLTGVFALGLSGRRPLAARR